MNVSGRQTNRKLKGEVLVLAMRISAVSPSAQRLGMDLSDRQTNLKLKREVSMLAMRISAVSPGSTDTVLLLSSLLCENWTGWKFLSRIRG